MTKYLITKSEKLGMAELEKCLAFKVWLCDQKTIRKDNFSETRAVAGDGVIN